MIEIFQNMIFVMLQNTLTEPPAGFQVLATKTYFTTSTYYTTLVDQGETITRTRTRVKSSVFTQTYGGGNEFTTNPNPSPSPKSTLFNFYSLGPNIYAKVQTLFQTYTYFTTNLLGAVDKSREILTQVSSSIFSTTQLPASVTIEVEGEAPVGTSVQISPSKLSEIKQSFLATAAPELEASSQEGSDSTKPSGASVLWDKPYLSSLKESFQSSIEASKTPDIDEPINDLNLPQDGPGSLIPPTAEDQPDIVPTRPQEAVDPDSSDSSSTTSTTTEGSFVDAVVGGIADGLGLGDSVNNGQGVGGLNVDLGPVLDAVATLLRGPIRSAIENRRSEAQDRSDSVASNPFLAQTQRAVLPSVSMLPAVDPNYIPVGGFGRSPDQRESESRNNYIPFQQEPRQASIPLALRAEPRYVCLLNFVNCSKKR